MTIEHLILGVLDISAEISDPNVAAKLRDFTISWSRYDYHGEIIEASTVDGILRRAAEQDSRWCLVLPYGHVIAERWIPDHWQTEGFFSAMQRLAEQDEFLIAGSIVGDENSWFGFANECLLVNLDQYRQLGMPSFDKVCQQPIEVPAVVSETNAARLSKLLPAPHSELRQPSLAGWNVIATSLRSSLPVVAFNESMLSGILDLQAKSPGRVRALAGSLGRGIESYCPGKAAAELGKDQIAFLELVQAQTRNARQGVFLWNIEGYADVETPPRDFRPPINSLYSVAAGFKPNRILHTHGWDESTRVVFFDYSPNALEIKRYLVEQWEGDDFPAFVQHLFTVFPSPATFYQLWDGLTPDEIDSADISQMWQRELKHWGSEKTFRTHWQDYRKIQHEYVCCNLLGDSAALIDQLADESNSIIWWSNAFFTVYGNWFHSLSERRHAYDHWVQQLAERAPELFLYGSDYNNVNVNSLRAAEYCERYRGSDQSCLIPCRLSKTEIRM